MNTFFGKFFAAIVLIAAMTGCTRDTAYLISNKLATVVTRSEEPQVSYSQYESERKSRLQGGSLAANLQSVTDPEVVRREILKVVPVGTSPTAAHSTLSVNGFSCYWNTPEMGKCSFPEIGSREVVIAVSDGKVADVTVETVK